MSGTNAPEGPLRVVIVEDSELMAAALKQLCEEEGTAQVVAHETDGEAAIRTIVTMRPDVVTLDLGLPDIDGFVVLERVMAEAPTPVLVLTATLQPTWRKDAYHTLTIGAVDVMKKPTASELKNPEWRRRFRERLRFVARVPVVRHMRPRPSRVRRPPEIASARGAGSALPASRPATARVAAIVGSAGSPRALDAIGRALSRRVPLPCPVLIAIHLGEGMEAPLARYLSDAVRAPVVVATDGLALEPGLIAVAPGRRHIEVDGQRRVRLTTVQEHELYAPSLDRLLHSIAGTHGTGAAAAVLSGMGSDGAKGLLAIRQAGGLTLGQDATSCVVYGIPQAAAREGAVAHQGTPAELAAWLLEWMV